LFSQALLQSVATAILHTDCVLVEDVCPVRGAVESLDPFNAAEEVIVAGCDALTSSGPLRSLHDTTGLYPEHHR